MKISYKKALALSQKPNWVSFQDDNHGVVYWNKVTGEILWLGWKGSSQYEKPKKP